MIKYSILLILLFIIYFCCIDPEPEPLKEGMARIKIEENVELRIPALDINRSASVYDCIQYEDFLPGHYQIQVKYENRSGSQISFSNYHYYTVDFKANHYYRVSATNLLDGVSFTVEDITHDRVFVEVGRFRGYRHNIDSVLLDSFLRMMGSGKIDSNLYDSVMFLLNTPDKDYVPDP